MDRSFWLAGDVVVDCAFPEHWQKLSKMAREGQGNQTVRIHRETRYRVFSNPFGRVCTLACCKPMIRHNAEPGDSVIGTGSARCGLSGKLIYAMRVEAVLTFEQYWKSYPSKQPSPTTRLKALGDNIWHRDASGNWCCAPGARHDERNRQRDLKGRNVLTSREFYYFGRDAITIPDHFHRLIAPTQGHKNTMILT